MSFGRREAAVLPAPRFAADASRGADEQARPGGLWRGVLAATLAFPLLGVAVVLVTFALAPGGVPSPWPLALRVVVATPFAGLFYAAAVPLADLGLRLARVRHMAAYAVVGGAVALLSWAAVMALLAHVPALWAMVAMVVPPGVVGGLATATRR